MAKVTIPGTKTLWSVIRGYINDMFTEVYNKLFETGKVLSDNNYTTAEKNKLATLTDEVLEYANLAAFPVSGTSGILYLAIDTGYIYRWTGSAYSEVSTGITPSQASALTFVTKPATGTLTTGSNAIDLTNGFGKAYHPYDMASGALTLTVAANPVEGASAHGIIISNGSTLPTVTAFTLLTGTYDNTNDVENHFFISYKYNGSDVLTAYLQWAQPA